MQKEENKIYSLELTGKICITKHNFNEQTLHFSLYSFTHIKMFSLIYIQAILNSKSEHLYWIHSTSVHIQFEL